MEMRFKKKSKEGRSGDCNTYEGRTIIGERRRDKNKCVFVE